MAREFSRPGRPRRGLMQRSAMSRQARLPLLPLLSPGRPPHPNPRPHSPTHARTISELVWLGRTVEARSVAIPSESLPLSMRMRRGCVQGRREGGTVCCTIARQRGARLLPPRHPSSWASLLQRSHGSRASSACAPHTSSGPCRRTGSGRGCTCPPGPPAPRSARGPDREAASGCRPRPETWPLGSTSLPRSSQHLTPQFESACGPALRDCMRCGAASDTIRLTCPRASIDVGISPHLWDRGPKECTLIQAPRSTDSTHAPLVRSCDDPVSLEPQALHGFIGVACCTETVTSAGPQGSAGLRGVAGECASSVDRTARAT